jgi:isoprenylcysteine carboxyl methyltransferase (ICMT) family protein YpbQ
MFVSIEISNIFVNNGIALLLNWFFFLGISLMILGIIIRQWSISVLGRFFSSTVAIQEGQKVVDKVLIS